MKLTKLAVLFAAAGLSASAFATNGYFAHGVGMKAKAMGGAGIAYAEDGFGIGANPATLSQAQQGYSVGASVFAPDRGVYGNTAVGQPASKDGNADDLFLVPEFAYVRQGNNGLSYGVAVYGNGGMNTDYGRSMYDNAGCGAPCGLGANRKTTSELQQLFIAPTVAKKLNDQHTVALSLNIVYQTFEAGGLGNFSGYTPGNAFDPGNHGKDSSTGIGLKFGWTGQLTKDFSLGAFYQPKTHMGKFDKYKYLFAEHGKFDIPASYGVGLAFNATPSTTLLFDIVQIDYSKIKALGNKNNHNAANTQLGEDDGKGFGWSDMTVYKLGLRHQLNDKTILRAGWNYGKQPISSGELDFNLLAPAVVEHHLTLGVTRKLDANSEITVSYMHAFNKKLTGDPNASASDGTSNMVGLEMKQNEIGVQYSWKY